MYGHAQASRIETPGITWNLKPQRTNLKLRKVLYSHSQ
jgi:hypothetical protein